jgi:hypothetical protein
LNATLAPRNGGHCLPVLEEFVNDLDRWKDHQSFRRELGQVEAGFDGDDLATSMRQRSGGLPAPAAVGALMAVLRECWCERLACY